jgi:Family of unknown function (DUF5640)
MILLRHRPSGGPKVTRPALGARIAGWNLILKPHARASLTAPIWLALLAGGALVACAGPTSGADSTSTSVTASSSPEPTEPSTSVAPASTSKTASPTTRPTTQTTTDDASLPAVLVGEWDASTSQSGSLVLVLTADGGFHQYGQHNGQSIDWRGTASTQGSRITFRGPGGQVETHDWSVSGGTLILADIPYLKTTPGAGGRLALAGEWMGMDDLFETLAFSGDGTFERRHDAEGVTRGTFDVQGDSVTLRLENGTTMELNWSISDAILTLTDSAGNRAQYARSS